MSTQKEDADSMSYARYEGPDKALEVYRIDKNKEKQVWMKKTCAVCGKVIEVWIEKKMRNNPDESSYSWRVLNPNDTWRNHVKLNHPEYYNLMILGEELDGDVGED